MRTGQELVLAAAKKYLVELTKKADKAKKEADEAVGVGSEIMTIYKEISELDLKSKTATKKLSELKNR